MSVALSDKGRTMLGDLHPQMAESPTVQRVVDAVGRELQRVEDAAAAIRDRAFPGNADDVYGTLSMWELTLAIPVNPDGVSLADRQSLVAASIRKLRASSGADWTALITQALGTPAWTQFESGYSVIVLVPPSSGTDFVRIVDFITRITPAHLGLGTGYEGSFIVGVSLIGDNI